MVWQKGESGEPKKEKTWRAALIRALDRASTGKIDFLKIDECAEALLRAASKGDITALKELGDRLDGKAKQQIVGGDPDDKPLIPSIIEIILKNATGAS